MPTSPSRAAVSWSGGKDSCLALLRAARDGHTGRTLLTMMDEEGPSKSHGLPAPLLQAQADAMDLAWRGELRGTMRFKTGQGAQG